MAEPQSEQPQQQPQEQKLQLRFMGTGTSAGIPMIACDDSDCACRSDDPRDTRSRASILVSYPDPEQELLRQFVVDTGPEFRQQAIAANLMRLDGVFYTHGHADHILGLDELRRFNAVMQAPIDIYVEPMVHESFRRMYKYIFEPQNNVNKSFIATLIAHPLEPGEPRVLHGATWTPIRLMHGRLPLVGFRVDYGDSSLAYCTDVSSIPPESYKLLQGLDVLVIDALRYRHHPTHLTVDQALAIVEEVQPGHAYFTHMAHEVIHAELDPKLPAGVNLAYDGLEVWV